MNTWKKKPVALIVADSGPLISLACGSKPPGETSSRNCAPRSCSGTRSDWKDGTEAVVANLREDEGPEPGDEGNGSGGGASGGN
jgi:hypothetical protein